MSDTQGCLITYTHMVWTWVPATQKHIKHTHTHTSTKLPHSLSFFKSHLLFPKLYLPTLNKTCIRSKSISNSISDWQPQKKNLFPSIRSAREALKWILSGKQWIVASWHYDINGIKDRSFFKKCPRSLLPMPKTENSQVSRYIGQAFKVLNLHLVLRIIKSIECLHILKEINMCQSLHVDNTKTLKKMKMKSRCIFQA